MPPAPGGPPALSAFLADLGQGEAEMDGVRLQHVLRELRVIAAAQMRRQRVGHTLQPTALVNVAYLKLFKGSERAWKDRGHFFTCLLYTSDAADDYCWV